MAIKDNHRNSTKAFKHVRKNQVSGELDYFFPMEVKSKADKAAAKAQGLEVTWTRLGYRTFEAVMVPCKNVVRDANGNETYIDTPSEVQRERYLELIKAEMNEQEAAKEDGRCNIPDGRGSYIRCPVRTKNPAFVPGGDEPKTLPVTCAGCKYEPFKHEHTVITHSDLTMVNPETGDEIPFEAASPDLYNEADRYMRLSTAFVDFVRTRAPELVGLARMLTQEYSRSDAARTLDIPISTAGSQKQRLMKLLLEFLDNCFIP